MRGCVSARVCAQAAEYDKNTLGGIVDGASSMGRVAESISAISRSYVGDGVSHLRCGCDGGLVRRV